MPSPFPGMDPYLEDSNIWPGFHHLLADEFVTQLNPMVGPKYYADVEVRTVVEEVSIAAARTIYPDAAVLEQTSFESRPQAGSAIAAVAIPEAPVQRVVQVTGQTKLRTVQLYTTETNQLVTSIEILSPFNKRPGEGIEDYRRKRTLILRSPVHLVESDLLRGGERPGREVNEPPLEAEYILLVNRGGTGDHRLSEIWPVALDESLPLLPIPLLPPDPDVPLDLAAALKAIYARAGYDWRLDYHRPVPPPELRPEMTAWLQEHLNELEKRNEKKPSASTF
jgi:hypothetical protein